MSTDHLTTPEPASAEVGAQFKPTDLEAGWAEAAIKMQDQGEPCAIRGAVEEATATPPRRTGGDERIAEALLRSTGKREE